MPGAIGEAAGLALGTVQWGSPYGIANRTGLPNLEEVGRLLCRGASAGITVLDTARAYVDSEHVIGELVGAESPWQMFTKLDPTVDSAADAERSLEASRRALRREKLAGILLHRARQRTSAGGAVWNFLQRERDRGGVRHIGISAGTPEEAWEALADPSVTCVQVACSLFDQRLKRAGYFEQCAKRGLLVFVRSIYLQGVAHLEPAKLPAHLAELVEPGVAIRKWAAERSLSASLPFLAFAASLTAGMILFGCETAVQLEENLVQWELAKRQSVHVQPLAHSIAEISREVLNPAMWPR